MSVKYKFVSMMSLVCLGLCSRIAMAGPIMNGQVSFVPAQKGNSLPSHQSGSGGQANFTSIKRSKKNRRP